jgi:pyridoxal phosphate enzyme (YggS family)
LLAKAALRASREPETVHLLAVSKRKPLEAIREALSAGQHDFGENFVQESLQKIEESSNEDITWHFIGHLQTNKTRPVAEHFQWVHTVDRLKVARRLSQQRPDNAADLNICIQVNVDREAGKSGVIAEELHDLAHAVAELPKVRLRGLMCIPAVRDTVEEQRRPFAMLNSHLQNLQDSGLDLDTLSMGMTADYEAAILEGATIVRIGTALFGKRE